MKKTYFAVIALLLAMALVGCDALLDKPEEASNVVGYTADGRAIVELDLSGSNARALHPLVAEAASDFYEVIFHDVTADEIYRTSWIEGGVARLQIPAGITYDNTSAADHGFAYIFAGRAADRTLLGVGTIIRIIDKDGSAAATKEITADSARVNFEIIALETDIIPADMTNLGNPTYGTFNISSETDASLSTVWELKTIDLEGKKLPAFKIDDVLPTLVTFDLKAGVPSAGIVKIADAAEGYSSPYASLETPAKLTKLTSVDVGTNADETNPAYVDDTDLTFPIGLLLTPNTITSTTPGTADPGLCVVYFDIPVYMYSDVAATIPSQKAAETWHFKGGLNNKLLDNGYATMSLGGSVLISVGDAFVGGDTGIIIGGDY